MKSNISSKAKIAKVYWCLTFDVETVFPILSSLNRSRNGAVLKHLSFLICHLNSAVFFFLFLFTYIAAPQCVGAVKCDIVSYSAGPSAPHKNWHGSVFHRLVPRMCWGWLTASSRPNLFFIKVHSRRRDPCDGHWVVTHVLPQLRHLRSSESEATRSKGGPSKWRRLSHFWFTFQSISLSIFRSSDWWAET